MSLGNFDLLVSCPGSLDPKDPARKYGRPDPNNRNNFTCNFCGKVTKGGAYRLKQHLVGGFRNVTKCYSCPEHVKEEVKFFMIKKQQAKVGGQMLPRVTQSDVDGCNDDEEDCETLNSKGGSSVKATSKRPRLKGPMDMYFTPIPEDAISGRKNGNEGRQRGSFSICNEESRDKACREIARWFYDAGIPFDAVNYESFGVMIESIALYGPVLKPPSMYELEVPLLKQEVDEILKQMEEHKKEWAQRGCSIVIDGWHDPVAERDFVNFLVNSPKGSMFIRSIDVSEIVGDVNMLFQMLDTMVEEVGENNVVQVVTSNTSNYVKAGRLLEANRPCLYWTPCTTHCVNLMLEDIGKITKVKDALKKCMFINEYINSYASLLNMMRRSTNQRYLHQPTIARFASCFTTLAQLHKQRNNLKKMVTSPEWNASNWPKEAGGKKVASYILQDTFWKNVVYALKLSGPLVKILKMVDEEKKPSMGYIFKAMDSAKEAIANSFTMKEEHYKTAFEYIDARWDCQLHLPLHAAGYFLNPELHYDNPNVSDSEEVMIGFFDCLTRLVPDLEIQDKISCELEAYRNGSGLFGLPIAVRHRKIKSPADWWSSFGYSTPHLQKFAMRVLSLTCSATGCEKNWDGFQLLHTKKKNKRAQRQLKDLVFVRCNRALNRRYSRKDTTNPILLEEIDECNEWLLRKKDENSCADVDDDFVFDDDDLTWGAVDRVVGTSAPSYVTTASRKVRDRSRPSFKSDREKGHASCSTPKTSLRTMALDDEDEIEEDIGVDDDYVEDDDAYIDDLSYEEEASDVPSRSVQSGADPIASDTPGRRDLQLQGTPSHFRRNAVYVRRRRRF
ncbi:uncharacterized protein [Spinacia oleracea]|uniref:Uncharacterized protein LOC110794775 n=1 Tax=Spinacia oleracea TaxID=3562 RepID=A0A9R0IVV1_SPIOL|nr:uncharacterized protein LOC110794775 [Spinacia oleracea]XP_056687194.1 uncharacterized protein LOC110794775 [Spinacia oleracea]XP_056687195.1 uncharacterized protein LOC110794775 [Spinacia oleracea]